MARPIAFDRDQVLHSAMLVFWQRGYGATSVKDLVAATHLQPGSLYGTFESKRGLFMAAIDAYAENARAFIHATLRSNRPPLQRIRDFFDRIIEESVQDRDAKGCMLVNTLLEHPAADEEIEALVNGMFQELKADFRRVLAEAQLDGTLSAGQAPGTLANFLVVGLYGLRVYSRTRPTRAALRSVMDDLLSVLDR